MPFATAAGRQLAYEWVGEERAGKPTLVFLHEGLGSIRQWRDFPAKVAAATGCRALVYDRYGYGQSDVLTAPRRTVRFMHDEALQALPQLLASLAVEAPVLIGHSDGASIALIHAGAGQSFSCAGRIGRCSAAVDLSAASCDMSCTLCMPPASASTWIWQAQSR